MADSVPQGFTLDTPQQTTHDLAVPEGFTLDKPAQSQAVKDQSDFEETIKHIVPMAPEWLQNATTGLAQGFRDLGHGLSERAVAMGNALIDPLPIPDAAKNLVTGVQNSNIDSMHAQEGAYDTLHPKSVMPGVGDNTAANPVRDLAHLAPYLIPGNPLKGALIGGVSQPMRPGENPLTSPLTSLAATAVVGLPIAVLNKTITKGFNSGALKDTIDSIGIPKADLQKQGAYQAIKDFAQNSEDLPPGSPALKQADKAKAFVNTIESLPPSAAVALRSDVGGQYLQKAIQSSELYAKRDALGNALGPIDTKPLLEQLNGLLNQPEIQATLGSKGGVANRSLDIIEGGAAPADAMGGINLANQPDSIKAAFGLLMNPAAKVNYQTLSVIRSNLDKAGASMRGDPASVFYKQASKIVDDFQHNLANQAGGDLAGADKAARAYYKNSVAPYLEKGLAQKLSDPKMESQSIYKMFTDFSDNNPERANRLYNLISEDGKAAVRGGVYSDALSASTDRTGFVDPVALRDFMENIPNTTGKYLTRPEDKEILSGIANLIDAHAARLGRANETYQRYLMAYGVENMAMGNIAHGAKQITSPFFYNWLYRSTYTNPAIKRFAIASSKLNPDSPEAARAVVKFTRMLRQAGIGELTDSDTANQTVDSLLKSGLKSGTGE